MAHITRPHSAQPPRFDLSSRLRLAGATLTLAALLSACDQAGQAAAPPGPGGAMPPMPVSVIEVRPQQVPLLVEAIGQTQGSKEIEIHARVSGILAAQRYQEGDRVKAGATLFSLEREPYEIALDQARAAVEQDAANLEQAQREAKRLKTLIETKAIGQIDLDSANTTLQTAQAALLASQARLRQAELNLSYTEVKAPLSGISARARHSVGNLITAGEDSSHLTNMDVIDPIWVSFSLSPSEAQKLRQAGAKAEVKLLLADGSLYAKAGRINFSASNVDAQTGMVAQRAEFANPDSSLLPGQFVRVQVSTGAREAYLVPQAALAQTEQGKLLFTVAADNTVAPAPVQTDGWAGHDWVVTSGLTPGDKVIIDNLMKLRPGAPVAPHAPGEMPAQAAQP